MRGKLHDWANRHDAICPCEFEKNQNCIVVSVDIFTESELEIVFSIVRLFSLVLSLRVLDVSDVVSHMSVMHSIDTSCEDGVEFIEIAHVYQANRKG